MKSVFFTDDEIEFLADFIEEEFDAFTEYCVSRYGTHVNNKKNLIEGTTIAVEVLSKLNKEL